MINTTKLAVANGTAAVTGTSGMMTYLGVNAPAIGIIFTGLMFVISVVFYVLNFLENRRHHKRLEDKVSEWEDKSSK